MMDLDFLQNTPDNGQLIRIGDDRMKLEDLTPGDCFVVSHVPWVVDTITAVIVGNKSVVDLRVVRVDEDKNDGIDGDDANRPIAGSNVVSALEERAREEAKSIEEKADESAKRMTTTLSNDWP
jgi:hypothetical protein